MEFFRKKKQKCENKAKKRSESWLPRVGEVNRASHMMKSSEISAVLPGMLTLTGRTLIVFTIRYRGEEFAPDKENDFS